MVTFRKHGSDIQQYLKTGNDQFYFIFFERTAIVNHIKIGERQHQSLKE